MNGAEEARELLNEWSSSGQPIGEWCAERDINVYSLSAYLRGPNKERKTDAPKDQTLVEIVATAVTAWNPRASARYRVLVGDLAVELGDDFDDDSLRRLLRVVASC